MKAPQARRGGLRGFCRDAAPQTALWIVFRRRRVLAGEDVARPRLYTGIRRGGNESLQARRGGLRGFCRDAAPQTALWIVFRRARVSAGEDAAPPRLYNYGRGSGPTEGALVGVDSDL